MMNKKTILIVLGIGVLLYLWNKGYFKSKQTPILVPEPAPVVIDEEAMYFDTSNPSTSNDASPMTQPQPSLDGGLQEVGETTVFDADGGEMFNDSVLASGGSFGYVRRPR